jgi:RNA polymerase sigma-70 factor (ECF subfamily)
VSVAWGRAACFETLPGLAVASVGMEGLKKIRRLLVRRLIRRGATPDDAEDAIQQAFVRLYAHEKKQPIRNPSALLVDLLNKVRVERWRRDRRHHALFVQEPLEDLDLPDFTPSPEDYAQADQRLHRIKRRLAALSPRTQQVFFLHRLEGLTYPQIAAAVGVSISAVEKHIARAALCIQDEMERE